jgi:hypothetical protein
MQSGEIEFRFLKALVLELFPLSEALKMWFEILCLHINLWGILRFVAALLNLILSSSCSG